jgi:TonB family protein
VIAASDTAVHVRVMDGSRFAVADARVDYLRRWIDSTRALLESKPSVISGEYIELEGPLGYMGQVFRTAYADSSRYSIMFNGPTGLYLAPSRAQLFGFLETLRAAEAITREMSGVAPSWDAQVQTSASDERPVASPQPYFDYQVEKQVEFAKDSPQPRYPASLKAANVEGEVLAQFVVDTAGLAEVSTFKVLRSSHDGFTQAVRDALPNMRFTPAEVGGRKVPQIVQNPFIFSLTK